MDGDLPRKAILPLPPSVRAQIQSSITITTLNDVIVELLKNSLDSGATNIKVKIDRSKGGCEVQDNGSGIPSAEFAESGGLGNPFHTSKYGAGATFHGFRGHFLASLSALSLLSIASRHTHGGAEGALLVHRSKAVRRQIIDIESSDSLFRSPGTIVSVYDLFGNLPVRIKNRILNSESKEVHAKEFHDLRQRTLALLLAWPKQVRVGVAEKVSGLKVVFQRPQEIKGCEHRSSTRRDSFDIENITTLFRHAYSLETSESRSWIRLSARTSRLYAHAAICLEPAPTKQMQFISIGISPLDRQGQHSVLYEELNKVFCHSAFGMSTAELVCDRSAIARCNGDSPGDSQPFNEGRRLQEQVRGPERHAKFYIRVDRIPDVFHSSIKSEIDQNDRIVEDILDMLKSMVWQFLEQHGFGPQKPRRRRSGNKRNGQGVLTPGQDLSYVSEGRCLTGTKSQTVHPQFMSCTLPPRRAFADCTRSKSSSRECLKEVGGHLPSHFRDNIERQNNRQHQHHFTDGRENSNHEGNTCSDYGSIRMQRSQLMKDTIEHVIDSSSDSGHTKGTARGDNADSVENCLEPHEGSQTDQLVSWRDPSSGKILRVNARTGLVVSDQSSSIQPCDQRISQPRLGSLASRTKPQARPQGPHDSRKGGNSWLVRILEEWNNPIFRSAEKEIFSVSYDANEEPGFGPRDHNALVGVLDPKIISCRLSRTALANAEVIGQVDDKFILINLAGDNTSASSASKAGRMLVLVDQHAADERCRIERLLEELCDLSKSEPMGIEKPMGFEISQEEARLCEHYKSFFLSWNIRYAVKQKVDSRVKRSSSLPTSSSSTNYLSNDKALLVIESLPSVIAERCRLEPRILIDLLRTEIWARTDNDKPNSSASVDDYTSLTSPLSSQSTTPSSWPSRLPTIPRPLLDILNSRACRSSIMFNDKLSRPECLSLIQKLSQCKFPFICAHGRKSCVPLVGIDDTGDGKRLCAEEYIQSFDRSSNGRRRQEEQDKAKEGGFNTGLKAEGEGGEKGNPEAMNFLKDFERWEKELIDQ